MTTPDYLSTHGTAILLNASTAFRREIEAPRNESFVDQVNIMDTLSFEQSGELSAETLRHAHEATVATRVAVVLATLRHTQNTGNFITKRLAGVEIALAKVFDPYARDILPIAKTVADSYSR